MKLAILALLMGSVVYSKSPIIRPNPADFSQISDFRAEWCSQKISSPKVESVCFGKSVFQATKYIRSVLVKRATGSDLYVENQWPGVELLKPRFGVTGPVLPSVMEVEGGQVLLLLSDEGAEEGLILQTPSLGSIQVSR